MGPAAAMFVGKMLVATVVSTVVSKVVGKITGSEELGMIVGMVAGGYAGGAVGGASTPTSIAKTAGGMGKTAGMDFGGISTGNAGVLNPSTGGLASAAPSVTGSGMNFGSITGGESLNAGTLNTASPAPPTSSSVIRAPQTSVSNAGGGLMQGVEGLAGQGNNLFNDFKAGTDKFLANPGETVSNLFTGEGGGVNPNAIETSGSIAGEGAANQVAGGLLGNTMQGVGTAALNGYSKHQSEKEKLEREQERLNKWGNYA